MEVMEIRAMRDLDHQCSDISLTNVLMEWIVTV